MTILGWQFNTWSDAAVNLILQNLLFILSGLSNSQCSYIGSLRIYQSRYNHTSQTQLNLFISVVDLNLGQNCLHMGGLVKIPLEQVPLAGKLKSLLWRLYCLYGTLNKALFWFFLLQILDIFYMYSIYPIYLLHNSH